MILKCSKCGKEVERDNFSKIVACFYCKRDRKREAAKKHAQKNMICEERKKKKYRNRQVALSAKVRTEKKLGYKLKIYKCECHNWHLTKQI